MQEKHWRQRDVVIKFEHLNPVVQEVIAGKNAIKMSRKFYRGSGDAMTILGALQIIAGIKMYNGPLIGVGGSAISFGPILRNAGTKQIQKLHNELAEEIIKHGVLKIPFEKNYPNDWHNPANVAKTHPVFHVKANGDLVFHQPTRMEYARLKFQQKAPVRVLGLNPWRWRETLRMPEASEAIKKWTAEKLKQWLRERMPKPRAAPRPALAQELFKRKPEMKRRRK